MTHQSGTRKKYIGLHLYRRKKAWGYFYSALNAFISKLVYHKNYDEWNIMPKHTHLENSIYKADNSRNTFQP